MSEYAHMHHMHPFTHSRCLRQDIELTLSHKHPLPRRALTPTATATATVTCLPLRYVQYSPTPRWGA